MLQTSNLSYQYPTTAILSFPDISLAAGQALLVCGESGCGKTTLLHLLAGLRKATSGHIAIDGEELLGMSAAKTDRFRGQYIGMVYQQPYFMGALSVLDNLLLSPYAQDQTKAQATAQRLGIGDLLSRYPHQMSVGQQQRATIARAVMNKPKLILADEPTSALDNKNCSEVIGLLLEEAKANQAALLIVTHDDRLRSVIANCIELSTRP